MVKTENKIFLVKCKREEIINRPTIEFVELTLEELELLKNVLKGEASKFNDEILRKEALLKKLEELK